jgi:hypothetical protein
MKRILWITLIACIGILLLAGLDNLFFQPAFPGLPIAIGCLVQAAYLAMIPLGRKGAAQ